MKIFTTIVECLYFITLLPLSERLGKDKGQGSLVKKK